MDTWKKEFYYQYPDLYEVEAKILSLSTRGNNLLIHLNPMPFFPGKGGQPADRGWVGEVPVVGFESLQGKRQQEGARKEEGDCPEESTGPILYPLVEAKAWQEVYPLVGTGDRVVCRIDGRHRQEYREQHTGQHLVSALLQTLFHIDTVSVHFGEQTTTIEVAQETLPEGYREAIQEAANRKILENPRVRTYWIDGKESESLSLRRTPEISGPLRVVEIEGVDRTACSGIHLDRLDPLRLVLIIGEERIRGRIRLHILTGERAVRRLARDEEVLSELRSLCTAGTDDLPRVVKGLQEETKSLKQRISTLKKESYFLKVKDWLQRGRELAFTGHREGVFLSLDLGEGEMEDLRFVEEAFLSQTRGVLLVGLVRRGKEGESVAFLASQNLEASEGHPLQGFDLQKLVGQALKRHGGKGGGSPTRIQGSFPSREQWEAFKEEVESCLR